MISTDSVGWILAALGLSLTSRAQDYVMLDLGTLGGSNSSASAINAGGQIVGGAQTASGDLHAFLWTPDDRDDLTGRMVDLGTLAGGVSSYATGINDFGQVVGFSDIGDFNYRAFLWTPDVPHGSAGSMIDLGVLNPASAWALAQGINRDGQVVGFTSNGPVTPFLWTPTEAHGTVGTLSDLGGLYPFGTGNESTLPYAINHFRQVVGWGETPDGPRAFLFTPGGTAGLASNPQMQELGLLPGDAFSFGTALNTVGQVVGNSQNDTASHAFLWSPEEPHRTEGAMTDLGTLGGLSASAEGINDRGVVVGWSQVASGEHHAFVWMPGSPLGQKGAMIDIGTLAGFGSMAQAINFSGVVVGNFQVSAGSKSPQHAFVAAPRAWTRCRQVDRSPCGPESR
jgi:probable HAF family extracellular repeat protein